MPTILRKSDPLADAQAAVDRLDAQRRPLADRLSAADQRVEAVQRARHGALVNGDPDADTTSKLDKACFEAAEARGGIEAALRAVVVQISEATQTRDRLQDTAVRERLAEAAERRASALDAAAEALASAATALGDARDVMVTALAEHGVRVANPLLTDGSTSAATLARPIVMAAIRNAAPGMLPVADSLGAALDTDCALVMRRAQSGRLRDFAEDVITGRVPAVEMPRPGVAPSTEPIVSPIVREPIARAVFGVPISYLATNGYSLVSVEEGHVELPERVALKGRDMQIAFDVGSTEGKAIVARLAAGGQSRARPRVFVDTDVDAEPRTPLRTVTTAWPDDRDVGRRA